MVAGRLLHHTGIARAVGLATLVLAGGLASVVAQNQPAPLRIEKVKDNLYVITGGRGSGASSATVSGNTSVFMTASGVVLVDTKLPGFGQGILEQVRSVTAKPITTIISTHSHADHVGGNPELPRNVEYVAHQNTRANMAKMDLFQGANASLLPGKTFSDRLTLFAGADRIDLYYFGRGHTSGDLIVVFPALRIAAFGDLFARKWAPLVDAAYGGSATEFPATLDKAMATLKDVDQIITGHYTTAIGPEGTFTAFSPVSKWSDLQEYTEFMHWFVDTAKAAKAAGKSVDEAMAGLKLPDRFRNYEMLRAREDVQRVYDETR